MEVPSTYDPIWRDIVTGKVKFEFEFLAAKILQGTLARKLKKNPSPSHLEQCVNEFRDLFAQNTDLPSVRHDLKKIVG